MKVINQTQHAAVFQALAVPPENSAAVDAALAAGLSWPAVAALMQKYGPDFAGLVTDGLGLFAGFSWPALGAFALKYGPRAFAFVQDLIQVLGEPRPAA